MMCFTTFHVQSAFSTVTRIRTCQHPPTVPPPTTAALTTYASPTPPFAHQHAICTPQDFDYAAEAHETWPAEDAHGNGLLNANANDDEDVQQPCPVDVQGIMQRTADALHPKEVPGMLHVTYCTNNNSSVDDDQHHRHPMLH